MLKWILVLPFLGIALFVTLPKLYRMARIRGFCSGAVVKSVPVLQKWHQTAEEHSKGRDVYWLLLRPGDIRSRGNHRVNVEKSQWKRLSVGDQVKVVTLPGDESLYFRDGIGVSNGNFVIDVVLLIGELGAATILVLFLPGRRRRTSQPVAG